MYSRDALKYTGIPGGPVVRTPCFHCRGLGSIPAWGTKISQTTQYGQKKGKKVCGKMCIGYTQILHHFIQGT